ncbi:hypothetical protein [Spirillospora sp. NPDC047279]|uniref:hypothetical protein n=1 Tax=Spirillospora sp. NPDC047279 TaxID=3155478 RepID=UPI0033C158F3
MGDAEEFVNAAGILTKRLIGHMNKRTNGGLLACVRAEGDSERISAVLKLEVVAPTGTTLEELASGEIRLATVTNVLEQPGDLQKGALVASGMSAEEVICGDTLSQQAHYFPEAFGIQVYARPSQGPSALLTAVARHDSQLAGPVAAALSQVAPGPLRDVLTRLSTHVPGLDATAQREIIDTLEQLRRPIGYLQTGRAVTAVIEQGELLIKGPAALILHDVEIRQRPDGKWEAAMGFEHEPKISYR